MFNNIIRLACMPRMRLCGAVLMPPIMGFLKEESAATETEYGLVTSGVALPICRALMGLGNKLETTISTTQSVLK
jgi:Flp pilus assembly pilin Flp